MSQDGEQVAAIRRERQVREHVQAGKRIYLGRIFKKENCGGMSKVYNLPRATIDDAERSSAEDFVTPYSFLDILRV